VNKILYPLQIKIPILDRMSADFLEQLIHIHNPKRVLEIGTAVAYSSIRIARNLRKKGILHTIEMSMDNIALAQQNIEKSGFTEKIKLIEGDALSILPKINKKYDFIFLDSDKEDYSRLFDFALILLKKNGIIFIDNLLWHGFAASPHVPSEFKNSTIFIREFNKIFMNRPNLKTSIIPIGDGIGIGIKIK
jgi:predicted O-methyltransferase YrrM